MATILIVDDRPVDRKLLTTLLHSYGYTTVESANGEDALRLLTEIAPPALIISDILMPTIDGHEFVRRLHQLPGLTATPVIFYTAIYHEPEARALASRCGVVDILTKPSSTARILGAVNAALHPRSDAAQPAAIDHSAASEQRAAAVSDVVQRMVAERNQTALLDNVCAEARRLTLARYAVVGLFAPGMEHLSSCGFEAGASAGITPASVANTVIGPVVRNRRRIRTRNPGCRPETLGFPADAPEICSLLGVPIATDRQVYGWLSLRNKVGAEEFSEADEQSAAILATYVGATLEQSGEIDGLKTRIAEFELGARRTSGQTKRAREEERARLARMLHDQLGQTLASLKLELHSLGAHVPASSQNLTSKVELLIQWLEEAIEAVRKFSSELRPAVLDQLGLIAALEWHVKEFERESGIACRMDSTVDQVGLEPGRGISVYRVLQEALTNVQRHAAATRVVITLREDSGELRLSITDNGRGISDDVLNSDSPGLLGMRERAALLGGHLDIHRRQPRGTSVTLTTPLAERRRVPRE